MQRCSSRWTGSGRLAVSLLMHNDVHESRLAVSVTSRKDLQTRANKVQDLPATPDVQPPSHAADCSAAGSVGVRLAALPAAAEPSKFGLKPPPPAAACMARPPLLMRLDTASRGKVALLVAPIGSGKTTLLAQWYRHAAADRRIAWLSLDEGDDESQRFFAGLIAAVRSVVPGFDARMPGNRHAPAGAPPLHAAVSESLGRLSQDLVIVLDGIQWLAAPALVHSLDFLLHHSSAHVHWVLAGRRVPGLNLGPFRLDDQLATLSAADLNVDSALVLQLGHQLCGRPLSVAQAEAIVARTEGWVAGVKFALLAASAPDAADGGLPAFSGAHGELARYLDTCVLQAQSAELRDFLLATSIVDKMTSELCNALLGISHSQALLEHLERSQVFTRALDSRAHWYRYHPLFLDFLRGCARRDAARLPLLHERASRWWAEHQFLAEALHHAFLGSHAAWRRELVAHCARTWLQSGEIAAVVHWCEKLPRAEVMAHEDMCAAYISSLILSRRFDEGLVALREMEARAAAGQPVHAGHLRLLHLMLGVLSDSGDDGDGAGEVAVDGLLRDEGADAFLGGILLTLQAYALLRKGRFEQAWRLAMRGRDTLERVSTYGFGYASVVASLAERAQGDVKSAATRCEQIFAMVRGGPRSPAWVNAATALAHVRYEANRLAEAEALCTEVLPLLSMASTVENFAIAYIMLARLKAIQEAPAEALRLLDYLHSVLESGSHRRFLAQVCGEKVRLCLAQGDLPRAQAVAAEFGVPQRAAAGEWRAGLAGQGARPYDEAWERFGLAHAWLLMQQKAYPQAHAVLGVLRDSVHAAGYAYRGMALEAALATCHWEAGEEDAALQALGRAFGLSRGYGFPRSVFDETPGLIPIIAAALRQRKLHHLLPSGYLSKFDSVLGGRPAPDPAASPRRRTALPLEPLTDREIDMLRLLAQGLSNQEISRRSQIALSTAKWHLKNVFAKLDVSTRTGALARARDLQLID
jgi:LuxR family transcriptional regulator, maltose regulon positive regulatory protein